MDEEDSQRGVDDATVADLTQTKQSHAQLSGETIDEEDNQRGGDLDHAIELMQRHGTLAATLERARLYAETARGALGIFHDSPERRALDEVIDFCLERSY